MLYLNDQIVRANGTKRSDAEIIAHVINVAPKYCNIPLSILSQSDINASDALSRAKTELRNYWKRNLEGKIGKLGGRYHGKSNRNESAYTSQEKNNQEIKEEVDPIDRANTRQSVETTKEKGPRELEFGRNSKEFVDTLGCKGTKHQIALSRNNTANGNKGENMKNNCFNCGKPGRYSKNCPERKPNPMG
jgi:hypothetical protein